jgi:hypothetical protein
MLLKVKDNPGLVRDTESNAILNINNNELQAYKKRKRKFDKIDEMEDKIEFINYKLSKIEFLLEQMVENKNAATIR